MNKYDYSNRKLSDNSGAINISDGFGTYDISGDDMKLKSENEHLEIMIANEDNSSDVIARELIYPVVFDFK